MHDEPQAQFMGREIWSIKTSIKFHFELIQFCNKQVKITP